MTNYKKHRIFSKDEIKSLRELYDRTEGKLAHQDYNLFDVEIRRPSRKDWPPAIRRLNEQIGQEPHSHYFIHYSEGSFARVHTDNDKIVRRTVVTVIDTHELVGGETLMYDVYPRKPRPANRYAKRTGDAPYGKSIMPVAVPMEVGESVIYDHATHHGVCKVHSGHRIVLISWYK